jgi:hypothetical protein
MKPGLAWIDDAQRYFTEWREVRRGRRKGQIEITIKRSRHIVPREKVRRFPVQRAILLTTFLLTAWAAEPVTALAPAPSFQMREITRLERRIEELVPYEVAWQLLDPELIESTVWAKIIVNKGGYR